MAEIEPTMKKKRDMYLKHTRSGSVVCYDDYGVPTVRKLADAYALAMLPRGKRSKGSRAEIAEAERLEIPPWEAGLPQAEVLGLLIRLLRLREETEDG